MWLILQILVTGYSNYSLPFSWKYEHNRETGVCDHPLDQGSKMSARARAFFSTVWNNTPFIHKLTVRQSKRWSKLQTRDRLRLKGMFQKGAFVYYRSFTSGPPSGGKRMLLSMRTAMVVAFAASSAYEWAQFTYILSLEYDILLFLQELP